LRTNPNLPQQRPPIVASDEQAASYYTRKGDDVDYYLNNLTTLVPEFGGHTWNEDLNRFIPEELKYNKVIDPIMYSDPNTMEGEAEFLSQTKGRPGGIGFRQSGGSSNDAFQKKLEEVAKRLKVSKADLMGIMKHESGLNPHAVNPYTGATGLIQFMPTTAKRLGTSVQELRNMSAIEQLNYVEKF
jgi:AraC-like DNA-binding protein